MLEAVRLARAYTEDTNKADFLEDKRTQQAVILNLLTLGEAATHIVRLYPDFPEQHPQLPWKPMRGMRNRMAHGYFTSRPISHSISLSGHTEAGNHRFPHSKTVVG